MTTDRAEGFSLHNSSRSQFGARYVPPDSGTLSGESTIVSFPAIALRDSIEQPETFNTGGIIMTGLDERDVTAAIQVVIARDRGAAARTATVPYHCLITDTPERVLAFIPSTTRRHERQADLDPR